MVVSFGKNPVAGTNQTTKPKNIRETKQGNPYYHTNTGKKVGTAVGVGVGLLAGVGTFLFTRNVKASMLMAGLYGASPVIGGFLGGAALDAYTNHNEKKKADQMAAYYA